MKYRNLQQISTGRWMNVLFTTGGDAFTVKPEDHRAQIATGWGLDPADLTVVDSDTDQRTGVLIPGPVIIPPISVAAAIDAAASDVVVEIDKAFTLRSSALTALEKFNLKNKVISLIAQTQGR